MLDLVLQTFSFGRLLKFIRSDEISAHGEKKYSTYKL